MANPRIFERLSGRELAALRREASLTQRELAQAAGVGRHAVSSWEGKPDVNPWAWAPQRIFAVLGIAIVPHKTATSCAHGDRVLSSVDQLVAQLLAHDDARRAAKAQAQAARRRVRCGAQTRKGHPCRLLSEPCRRRCKFHGGCSTGPRTPEGRARIAEAQRRRWRA